MDDELIAPTIVAGAVLTVSAIIGCCLWYKTREDGRRRVAVAEQQERRNRPMARAEDHEQFPGNLQPPHAFQEMLRRGAEADRLRRMVNELGRQNADLAMNLIHSDNARVREANESAAVIEDLTGRLIEEMHRNEGAAGAPPPPYEAAAAAPLPPVRGSRQRPAHDDEAPTPSSTASLPDYPGAERSPPGYGLNRQHRATSDLRGGRR